MKKIPFYPFLVAIYPVLALGSYNIKQIHLDDILRPLLTSLLMSAIVLGLSQLVLSDWHRAALVSALILIIFFSYGHIYAELKAITLGGLPLFRSRTIAISPPTTTAPILNRFPIHARRHREQSA